MTKIHLETFGQGKPIVLVHGWAMHSGIWREFARQLALDYRVICVDLPGHGRSEAIDTFTLARISAELVKAIPEQSCCWLGWSLGATVALDMAARYPERVSSLILLAGNPAFVGATPTSRLEQAVIVDKPQLLGLDASRDVGVAPATTQWPGMDVLLLDAFSDQLNENCQATLLRFLSLQIKGLPDQKACLKNLKTAVLECAEPDKNTLQSGLEILKQADLRPVLSGLNIPVSVILGGLDALVPVAVGEKMLQLLPSLELNIIDRAGHVPFLSHCPETLAIISQFMDNHALG